MEVKLDERPYEIEVVRGHKYYRLVAPNGEIIMHSETFFSDWNAIRSARKVCKKNRFKYSEADPSLGGVDFLEDEPVKTNHLDKEKKR